MQTDLKIVFIGIIAGYAILGFKNYLARDPDTGEGDHAPDMTDYAEQAADAVAGNFEGVDDMTGQANTAAFLAAIRLGEGTSGADGFSVLCGGGNFDTWAAHPAMIAGGWTGWPLPYQMAVNAGYADGVAVSTAAGAYQITRPTWKRIAARLGLGDFSPASQDAAALQLIAEKGALGDVQAGRTAAAVAKLGGVWASLPGAAAKQRQVTMVAFNNQFTSAGGVLA